MATNRQLAQQARQHRQQSQLSSLGFRQLSQQARQNREHEPIACQPLTSQLTGTVSLRHQLDPCNILCRFCGAEHWIEEKVQGSTKISPKFSTCCQAGAVIMDEFDDPPEPLYSLLMECTPCIFRCHIFIDNKLLYNSARIFEIIIMPSHSVRLVSKQTSPYMVLKVYIHFVSKDNCVISLDHYFHYQEDNLHFHKSIYIIQIPWNKHNIG